MKKSLHKKPAHRLILWAVLCFTLLFSMPRDAAGLSVQDETLLGQKYLGLLQKYFKFVEDDYATAYINSLGQYLTKHLETKHFPYRFYIVKSSDLNAFAVPGGHIFIFSGLIEASDKVDELASVVCHEIGHISGRHMAYRLEQSKKLNLLSMAGLLAGILIGGDAGGAIMAGTMGATQQAQLSYSRDDERQADQLGVKYMNTSGFDPSAQVTIMRKLAEASWGSANRIPNYLLTHPGGAERMATIENMISGQTRKPENSIAVKFQRQFPVFKTIVKATTMDPLYGETMFRRELEKQPDSTLAHFGLGIVLKEGMEYGDAIHEFQEALKGKSYVPIILAHLGEAYQLAGRDDEAIVALKRALKLDRQNRTALFLLAHSYQSLEEYQKAIDLYKKLTYLRPVKKEVYYNLGICYGREKRLARAHYNFGVYFMRLRQIEKARFHLQKADALCQNDPSLKNRIRKATEMLAPKHKVPQQ